MSKDLTPEDIRAAALRIRSLIVPTSMRHSAPLSERAGGQSCIKLESEQTTGSFKLRGAANSVASLPLAVAKRGVVASSAGNHGLGVAYAASQFQVSSVVFVPNRAPSVKKEGILRLGSRVMDSEPDYDAAMVAARKFATETGATFINPCLGLPLLAGQGTVALEILEQLPDVRTVVVPVGGAGLVGGISAYLRREAPHVRIVGVQSENTAAMTRSLAAGHVVPIDSVPTLADGLAGQVDDEALAIGRFGIDEMVTLTEDEIAFAIAWLWKHERARAEGAGAVAAGAMLLGKISDLQFPAVAILSGGNIDEDVHNNVVSRFAESELN